MGGGRDKRKKHEDFEKHQARAARQSKKLEKGASKADTRDKGSSGDLYNGEENIESAVKKLAKVSGASMRKPEEIVLKDPPSTRVNCVFLKHPTKDNELILFGGEHWNGAESGIYNDLFIYNEKRSTWTQIKNSGPSPRSSAQGFTHKHFVYIHGGEYASRSQSQFYHFKEVWRFNTQSYQWDELPALKSGGPSARSGHRVVPHRRNMVIFGGFYDTGLQTRYFNDLYILSSLDSGGKWTELSAASGANAERPHPRSGHCMGVYQDTLFVYGGYSTERASRLTKAEATVHHDLWMCSLPSDDHLSSPAAPANGEDDDDDSPSSSSSSSKKHVVVWQKLRMGGIPPPIRSGVTSVIVGKKLILFGGVVDIDSSGGKTASSFYNDLYALHMDTNRFFPLVLRKRAVDGGKHQAKKGDDAAVADPDRPRKIKNLIEYQESSSSSSSSSDSSEEEGDKSDSAAAAAKPDEPLRESREVIKATGQSLPHRRMNTHLCVDGHTLYIYGGVFETGKKEVTLNDMFSLNLNTMDNYNPIFLMDLTKSEWKGPESEGEEDDGNSWESGSTVVSEDYAGRSDSDEEDLDELLHEEEQATAKGRGVKPSKIEVVGKSAAEASSSSAAASVRSALKSSSKYGGNDAQDDDNDAAGVPQDNDEQQPSDNVDDDAPPMAIPADASSDSRGSTEPQHDIAGRTAVIGKKGMKIHRAQLEAQLGANSSIPTPTTVEESPQAFFKRTARFWQRTAAENLGYIPEGSAEQSTMHPATAEDDNTDVSADPLLTNLSRKQSREVRREAQQYANQRHTETIELMKQLNIAEERQKEEEEYFRNLRNAKKANEENAEQEEAAAAESEKDQRQESEANN